MAHFNGSIINGSKWKPSSLNRMMRKWVRGRGSDGRRHYIAPSTGRAK